MAIVDLYCISADGSFGQDKSEVTLEWLVFSDVQEDFALAIMQQGFGDPRCWKPPGTPYRLGNDSHQKCYAGAIELYGREIVGGDGNFTIQVGTLQITPINNGTPVIKWRVRQRYSTQNEEAAAVNEVPSENDPITISVSYEWENIPFDRDVETGRPVVNSAGQFFSPPAERRRKIPVYSITRREFLNPINKANVYSNSVNSEIYYGAAPGTLLMDSIVPQFDGRTWKTTYNIKEKREGWETYLLDTGYYECIGDSWAPILYPDGTPPQEPALLDGMGRALPWGAEGVNVGPFHKYSKIPFGLLSLPNPFTIHSDLDFFNP